MRIPDAPFGPFRQDPVVITRTPVQPDIFGDDPETPVVVAETKGDLQVGPRTRRRLEAAGTNAEARLFLDSEPFAAAQVQDRVVVAGQEFVVEEKSDVDQSLLLKSR